MGNKQQTYYWTFVKATFQAEEARPTFKWLSERSSSGIQNLAIDFGTERHIVALHPYNPLSYEVKSSVDPCIFKGTLQMEPTTEVLVTGGCPGADTFEVSSLWFQQKQSRKCFELLFLAFMFRLSLEIGLKAQNPIWVCNVLNDYFICPAEQATAWPLFA